MPSTTQAIRYAQDRQLSGFDHATEGHWRGPFYFIQGADPQMGLINDYIEKQPPSKWDQEIELTNRAVDAANLMEPKPKFFIVCGDLVHSFPGDEFRDGQEQSLKECLSRLDPSIPLVCVCGNHDVGQTPTPESVEIYRQSFGDDYFSFWAGGVKCIVLNSQFYFDCSAAPDLRAHMDDWLDIELEDLKTRHCKHVIVFQHIALFIENADEDDQYFNLPKSIRKQLIDKFGKAGVKFVFCGHYHRNAGGSVGDLNCVVSSAIGGQLGKDKSGFRLVKVLDDVITHKYFALEDAPSHININSPVF